MLQLVYLLLLKIYYYISIKTIIINMKHYKYLMLQFLILLEIVVAILFYCNKNFLQMIVNIHYFLFKLFQPNTIVLNFTISFLPTINFCVFHIHPIILIHPILHSINILNDLPITIHLNFLMEKMLKVHITFHSTYEDYYTP